jgi:hypothetical protein
MQKHERKRVAGGASWKLLKTKGQICSGSSDSKEVGLPPPWQFVFQNTQATKFECWKFLKQRDGKGEAKREFGKDNAEHAELSQRAGASRCQMQSKVHGL